MKQIEQRDDHTRVWEIVREVETTHPDGSTTVDTVKSQIHEKGSGLCYPAERGQFVPAVAEWRERPDGFVIDRCAYGVSMGKTIASGLGYTADGHELILRPAYLMISDGVNEAHLAVLNPDAAGSVVPEKPSVLRFPDAFGPGYDLEYVAEKGGFHQNLIIAQALGLPADFDPDRTGIFLYTEMNLDSYLAASGCEVLVEGEPLNTEVADLLSPTSRGGCVSFSRLGHMVHAFSISRVTDSSRPGALDRYTIAEKRLMKDASTGAAYLVESLPVSYLLDEARSYPVIWDFVEKNKPIASDEVWGEGEDKTYLVSCNLDVSAQLRILPGVFVKLNKNTSIFLLAGGKVLAEGTRSTYIRFTESGDNDPDWGEAEIDIPPANPGRYTCALQLCQDSSDQSVVRYCMFRKGGMAVWVMEGQQYAIRDNIISDMPQGIGVCFDWCSGSEGCRNNLMTGCQLAGIVLSSAGINLNDPSGITNNTVNGSQWGIYAYNSNCNILTDNMLSNCAMGIYKDPSSQLGASHNGFWRCSTPLSWGDRGPTDIVLAYEADPYVGDGEFFLDQFCGLIDAGSQSSSAAGLSGHTTSPGTNETGGWTDSGTVDIGYHYPHLPVKPYLQNVGTDQATVMWLATASGSGSVEWGPVGAERTQTAAPTPAQLDGLYIYQVILTGLQADTLYRYRVKHRSNYSHDNTFYTAKSQPGEFRFIAYGDNRGGHDTNFRQEHFEVVNSMLVHAWSESEPRPRFILHCGDFVNDDYDEDASQWQPHFFEPAAGLLRSTPLWPSIGNHEYEGDDDASNYRDLFSVPEVPDKPENYPQECWYSFDYANCHFIVLDTGLDADVDYIYGTEEDPSDQYEWLVDDISSADNADWVIVLLHIPPYSDANPGHDYNAGEIWRVRQYLAPVFEDEDHPADLVISGHNHIYERSQARETQQSNHWVHYIVTGGGGAASIHSPDDDNPKRVEGKETAHHHFCIIDIDGTTATLNVVLVDGTKFEDDVVLEAGVQWQP